MGVTGSLYKRCGLLTLAVLAMGCDGSTEPFNATGAYSLRSYQGQTLPALIAELPTLRVEITEGALTLGSALDYTLVFTQRVTQGTAVELVPFRDEGQYEIDGRTISFYLDALAGSADPGPHYFGTFSADGKSATVTLANEDALMFRK